jgi:hypothetical protein
MEMDCLSRLRWFCGYHSVEEVVVCSCRLTVLVFSTSVIRVGKQKVWLLLDCRSD